MLRARIEQWTRSLSFRRRMPAAAGGGPIVVSPSCGLRFLFRSMERADPKLVALAAECVRPGHTVWDVGANLGLFAFAAAHRAGPGGRVFALEPDAWLVQLLRRSCALQPPASAPVQIVPAAVAAAVDLRTFNIAARSRATSFLEGYGSSQAGGVAERHTVVSVSLDWLAERLPLPDVLKIDVERAEVEVFEGARGLLARKRPVVICEVSEENAAAVAAFLKERNYRVFDGECPISERKELDAAPWSTVAFPA
ncbi:MAG: FkbM family methyltransferase [Burkholderiales bacterium]|nr:FkbM family methyltransferase [Burkholderiales bacterium]